MVTLHQSLNNRTWRELRILAYAHRVKFDNNFTRAQAHAHMVDALSASGVARVMRDLSPKEQRALQALQANGGRIALWRFVKAFGEIRPYKPWREDRDRFPKYPWKNPQSTAEKLWYLGLIEILRTGNGQPDQVVLPDEVHDCLPPLPRPRPVRRTHFSSTRRTPNHLRRDLALFFGYLLGEEVKALHGRWLSPTHVRLLEERMGKSRTNLTPSIPLSKWRGGSDINSSQKQLQGVRSHSELQTSRLKVLHYLAEAAGMVTVENQRIQPTFSAGLWLKSPDTRLLREAVTADLKRQQRLWDRYRFPPISARVWSVLWELLDTLQPERLYRLRDVLNGLNLRLPDEPLSGLREVMRQVLHAAGWLTIRGGYVIVHADVVYPLQQASFHQYGDSFALDLPHFPPLTALADVSVWGTFDGRRVWVDTGAVRKALERGVTVPEMMQTLSTLCAQALPHTVLERLQFWEQAAQRITLRQVHLLTVADEVEMTRIRSDWRLRPLLGEALSAHHLVVKSAHAGELSSRLERRDIKVTQSAARQGEAFTLKPDSAAYHYLATKVYQRLGTLVTQDIKLPAAVVHDVAAHLPEGQADMLDTLVDDLMTRIQDTLTGHAVVAGGVDAPDAQSIQQIIESAHSEGESVTIEYYSPGSGQQTVRTIEPTLIYTRAGATYIEAWCQLDNAVRTFRMDRILRMIHASAVTV